MVIYIAVPVFCWELVNPAHCNPGVLEPEYVFDESIVTKELCKLLAAPAIQVLSVAVCVVMMMMMTIEKVQKRQC